MNQTWGRTFIGVSLVGGLYGQPARSALEVPQVAATRTPQKNVDPKLETRDRTVDQVALQAQQKAIARMQDLLRKYRGTGSEPNLLARMAEAWQQEAAIRFRIAHGKAHRKSETVDLQAFNKSMKASITTLNDLIGRFPSYPDLHEAYFFRAKAYDEMSDIPHAKRDYSELVTRFPEAAQSVTGHMRLAEYAIDDNLHEIAIQHLQEIEKKPEDSQYPFALYKLAWSHYNLQHFDQGLKYLERHVDYYRSSPEPQASDIAIIENSLMDTSLFHYEAFEKKAAGHDADRAWAEFHRIEKGPLLGKMLLRYARLLRAGNFDGPLLDWKNRVLKNELHRPESLEVAMTTFEDRVNKREFLKLSPDASDIVHVYRDSPEVRANEVAVTAARKLLIDTASTLQALTIKNKKANEVRALAGVLETLYLSFIEIVDRNDPLIPKSRFNLAEADFEIGEFEKATLHYRWIVENWKDHKTFDPAEAGLRAIAARYQTLKGKNIIPTSLNAKLQSKDAPRPDAMLVEWLRWIDSYKGGDAKIRQAFLNYSFEANRALYAAGDVVGASKRLLQFVDSAPESEFAIPSASLVLDTMILAKDWEKAYELTRDLRKVKAWSGSSFATRLEKLEVDNFYKIAETRLAEKNWSEAESLSRTCLKRYEKSERAADCRLIGAQALLAEGKESEAGESLTQLIEAAPKSEAAIWGLVNRGRLREKGLDVSGAALDYRNYLTSTGRDDASLKERALLLTWLQGDFVSLKDFWKREDVCGSKGDARLGGACGKFAALLWMNRPELMGDSVARGESLSLASVEKSSARSLRALAALRGNDTLGVEERLKLLGVLAKDWDKIDALAQFEALPLLPETLAGTLASARKWASSGPALQPTKNSIKRRLTRISELEEAATQLMKLPWARLRAEALNETAEAYMELAAQLRGIPAPKDLPATELESYGRVLSELSMPFEEKAQDIRKKAFDLAAQKRVERVTFEKIAVAFFRDNPSQAKKLQSVDVANKSWPTLDRTTLETFDPKSKWEQVARKPSSWDIKDSEARAKALRRAWWEADQAKHFALAAWYLRESRESSLVSKETQSLMQALMLQSLGARAEAYALVEGIKTPEGNQPLLVTSTGRNAQ